MFCLMSCRPYVGREVVSIGLSGSAETTVFVGSVIAQTKETLPLFSRAENMEVVNLIT